MDLGSRFENMIAFHLLKHCCYIEDTPGKKMEFRFFRDTEQREVDFVLLEKNRPILFLECKFSGKQKESKSLQYLKNKFPTVRSSILYFTLQENFQGKGGIEHLEAADFLSSLS